MKEKKLPEGWEESTVKDSMNNYDRGRKPISTKERNARKGHYPYYGATGIIDAIDGFTHEGDFVLVGEDGANLLSRARPLSFLASGKIWVNNHAHVLQASTKIINEFFNYYFQSLDISEFVSGSAQPKLNQRNLNRIPIPLPPLEEQKRIVAKLDQLMGHVDKVKEQMARVPELLKQFRQSVLTQAVTGQLTKEWRVGKELGEWEEKRIGDCCEKPKYGTSKKSLLEGKVPVLRMGNLQNGRIDWGKLKFTSDLIEIEKYALQEGDILFNRTNSPELVGKTSIYSGERQAIYAGYLIRVRCDKTVLLPTYLNFILNSPLGRRWAWTVKSDGVSQSNINSKKLSGFRFNLPPLPEQKEIVRRVESLFAMADRIEQQYAELEQRVEVLPQAILAEAFRGELV